MDLKNIDMSHAKAQFIELGQLAKRAKQIMEEQGMISVKTKDDILIVIDPLILKEW